jgi:hypothetical protein
MTKPKRYKRYSSEFKQEAIRRASEEGITDAQFRPGHFGLRPCHWKLTDLPHLSEFSLKWVMII